MEKHILSTKGEISDLKFHDDDLKSITGTITINFTSSGDFSEYINEDGVIMNTFKNEIIHEFIKSRQLPEPRRRH